MNFNWGIIGAGRISAKFAKDLRELPNARLLAVASLSGKSNSRIEAEKVYSDYESLVADPEIDIIYIGNIHPKHYECVKLCIMSGKAVICEKPLTMNANETRELIKLSKEENVFFMEAMWTRFLPANKRLTKICINKEYGKIEFMDISFGDYSDISEKRLFEPELGGGVLLDLGVYGISYANMLLGEHPKKVMSWANKTDKNMDLFTSVQLEYPSGCIANMNFSIDRHLRNEAFVVTEKAEFSIPTFWCPEHFLRFEPNQSSRLSNPTEDYYAPIRGYGYYYEAAEVMRCLEDRKIESSIMTHRDSLAVMETLDTIRNQCGIIYPNEKQVK